jgi:hypothetical protein
MSKTQSGYESSDLKITSGVFSIVDRVTGYVSTDSELQAKLLWENAKGKGLILSKAEVLERRIVIGLKRTHVSRFSSPGKCEGERFDIVEVSKSRSERGLLIQGGHMEGMCGIRLKAF